MTHFSFYPKVFLIRRGQVVTALLTLFALIILPACSLLHSDGRSLTFPSGTIIVAEVADKPETRQRGLMFRDHLPEGGGMLFVFEADNPYSFWMKNCKFPIDIIWIDKTKNIVHIARDTPPCKADPCPVYGPKNKSARYVLEVAAGFAKEEGLKLGVPIRF